LISAPPHSIDLCRKHTAPRLGTSGDRRPLDIADPTMSRSHLPRFDSGRSETSMSFMLTIPQRVVLISHGKFAEDGPRPQVLMAYEDLNMALRAMNVLALIAREAGDVVALQFAMWRFAAFDTRALREAAARQAVQADVIIVAPGNSGGGLSSSVTSWLDQWTSRRLLRPGALVAVLDPTTGKHHATSVVGGQLQAVAALTGMDFFCGALRQFDPRSIGKAEPPLATDSEPFADKPGLNSLSLLSHD